MGKKKAPEKESHASQPPAISVSVEEDGQTSTFQFRKSFHIGRDESCEIQVSNPGVSRRHAEVFYSDGLWILKDLGSGNGTFVDGNRIDEIVLKRSARAELGSTNVSIQFSIEHKAAATGAEPTMQVKPPSLTQYVQHYFSDTPEEKMGQHTRLIHRAYMKVQKKQKTRYFLILGFVLLVAIGIGIYGYMQHQEVKRQKLVAEQIFYSMKSLELELTRLQTKAEEQKDQAALQAIAANRAQQKELSRSYDHFLSELHIYDDSQLSETDRIIYRIARIFGECEIGMPADFGNEVRRYIKKWRTTDRLQNAIERADTNGYAVIVTDKMLEHDLPPQFFYLALQESDFDSRIVGPKTRWGVAKGFWQFIPSTALHYGLRTGPLLELRRYDPRDERFNFKKSTEAAARYIRDIYNTEAQASGLLVIASYNWGQNNVRSLVRKMPANPRERNFWKLLKLYRKEIPRETYDYVFYIISAAVIGENPRLFGFNFENPLKKSPQATG